MWSQNYGTFHAITSMTAVFELSLDQSMATISRLKPLIPQQEFIPDDIIRLLTFDTF